MTEPKNAAREVASRLAERMIRIKHVQALDLIAAGCGYQDRSKLADVSELPKLKSVNARLLSSVATTIARHDLERRDAVVSVTTDVLMDQPATMTQTATPDEEPADREGAGLPSLEEWIERLEELVERLPKTMAGEPNFAHATASIPQWSSEFAEYVRLHSRSDEATSVITALVDGTMRIIEAEEECTLGFDPQIDDVAEGECPIDYDRLAAVLEPVIRRKPSMGPLELALRDGAGRANAYSASFSEDPDTGTGSVRKWLSAVDEAFRFGRIPSDRHMRDLLSEGNGAVWGISHMLPADDRLRGWLDVAAYPNIIDNEIDPEGSGIPGIRVEVEGFGFLSISPEHLSDPSSFLATARGRRLVSHLTSFSDYEGWSRENGPMEDSVKNAIATRAVELLRNAKTADERTAAAGKAITSEIGRSSAEDDWYRNTLSKAQEIMESIGEATKGSDVDFDEDHWCDRLYEAYVDAIYREDDSEPSDVIHHTDKVEIMFFLHSPDHGIDDMCTIRGPWPDPKRVMLDDEFIFAISRLGITPEDWIKAMGADELFSNSNPYPDPLDRIMTAEELAVCVENGCTNNFCIVAYGIVPLNELLKIDLSRPFTIGNASIAVYNQYAGTFHEKRLGRDVTFMEGVDGSLQTSDVGYSPKDICGMVESYYCGHIYEPQAAARNASATSALDAAIAVEGLRRNQPGVRIDWKAVDDEGLVLEASFGTNDPNGRYALRNAIARFDSVDSVIPEIEIVPK